ncbi:MAG TPA: TIGR03085 family metal-binding protein [Nocardioides sp.]|jgi:uncharacterized protein (TIGR03085 family)|nr:TIGR03085 family metal-binding protein [Nocardioides sp.]
MTSFARRERLALADTALQEGPDAPTLCDPWDVRALVCHLLVRERHPLAAAGIAVPPLSGLTEHAMSRLAERDFADLVERFRHPWVVPFAVPGVEQVWNTLEFLVHHEDVRRAQDGWTPRTLAEEDEATVWSMLKVLGRGLARGAGVPVAMEWGTRTATLRGGDEPAVLRGLPSEIALALHGRQRVAEVEYAGPADAAARLRGAALGV